MPETKDEIAAQRDALQAENENLRGQLAAAGARPAAASAAQHTFQLSEGDRQELAIHGQVNIGGRMRTKAEVEEMLGDDQRKVDLGDAPVPAPGPGVAPRSAVRGVDFVYPSVAPGEIDPAVAGTPGINGPAAEQADDPADDPVDQDQA